MISHIGVVGNAVGVEKGEKFGEVIVSAAIHPRHQASFVGIVEADHIDLADKQVEHNFNPDVWGFRHRGNSIEKDGCLGMWDKRKAREFDRPEWDLLTDNAWHDRRGTHREQMNSRWALTMNLEFLRADGGYSRQPITIVHFPPPRYPQLRSRAAGAAEHYSLFMGDLNLTERALRRRYENRKIRGTEVIHVVAKPLVNVGKSTKITLGDSDHPGVKFPVRF